VSVRTTLLAAHTVPPEYRGRADEYIDTIARQWLPQLLAEGLVDAVDVFCERIAFSVEQSERLLAAACARSPGRRVRAHARRAASSPHPQASVRSPT
jgi:imidazolonepropionase